ELSVCISGLSPPEGAPNALPWRQTQSCRRETRFQQHADFNYANEVKRRKEMASQSIRERTIAENSLVVLLQGLQGEVTTVDLRDESTARGRVVNVDAFMNVRLEEVLYRDRRGRVSEMADLFITGRNVRYVHIPDHMNITKTIQTQLEKIHRVRNFVEKGGRKEYAKKPK
ncbi:hypothetical protein NFI96_015234, partial [Prochilodus magdalenae]